MDHGMMNSITAKIRKKVIKIVKGNKDYTCVPLQGSGSFGVEAMIINFVRRNEPLLILINGAYGERIEQICKHIAKQVHTRFQNV